MEPVGCCKMSVNNYQHTLCSVPFELRPLPAFNLIYCVIKTNLWLYFLMYWTLMLILHGRFIHMWISSVICVHSVPFLKEVCIFFIIAGIVSLLTQEAHNSWRLCYWKIPQTVEPLWAKLRPYREMVLGEPRTNKKSWTLHCGCLTTWASPRPQHLWFPVLSVPHLPAVHTRPYLPFWGRRCNSTPATLTLIGALASCIPLSVYIFLETNSHLFTCWYDMTATILVHLSNLLNISFSF
jgi:hypothetical protein